MQGNNLFRLKEKGNAQNQHIADTADMVATEKLAVNMLNHTSKDTNGKYLVNAQPVSKKTIEKLALENVKYLREHDEFMPASVLNKRARELQVIQDAANENTVISADQSSSDDNKLALGGNHDADLNANTAFDFTNRSTYTPINTKQFRKLNLSDLPKELNVPPSIDLNENALEAKNHFFKLEWFYNKVKNKGAWDYKQKDSKYENFGNFHYGLMGKIAGISDTTLLKAAGWAQKRAGTSKESWGDSGIPGIGGKPPYGDDPVDQYWIKQGIEYYQNYYKY